MITYLIELVGTWVIAVIGKLGYSGIFILMTFESSGVPAPSEIIMPFAGFLVGSAKMTFAGAVIAGTLGNLAGSLLAYEIGKRGGRPLIEKYGRYIFISEHDIGRADRWFSQYGEATVFVGRLLPIIRTYISFPAGISRMNMRTFIMYTLIGAAVWSAVFTWLGVKLQTKWELIHTSLRRFDMGIALLVGVAVLWYAWRHIKKNRSSKKAP